MKQGAALCCKVRMAMASKNRLTVNLSEQEFSALVNLAARSKVSKAWLGRQAIADLLERTKEDHEQLPLPLSATRRGREA